MKKFDFGQMISVTANVGVIGGLIFLGFEIRQNTVQLRAEASYSVTESLSRLNVAISTTPALAELINRGEQDLSSLDATELTQFASYQLDRINLAVYMRLLEQQGLADIQFPFVQYLGHEFRSKPGLQDWLNGRNLTGPPELYDFLYVESR